MRKKKISVQEIIALLMISSLIVLTFLHPAEFKERFGQVLSAVLGAFFVTYKARK